MRDNVNLKYVSSRGEAFLFQTKKVKTRSANFMAYTWAPQVFEVKYGAKVKEINKEAVEYQVELLLSGSSLKRRQFLEAFHLAADLDIAQGKAGRLYFGNMYIECFAITSSTDPEDNINETANTVDFYCPYPSWIYSRTYARPTRTVASVAELMGVPEEEVVLSSGSYPVPFAALPSSFRLMFVGPIEEPYAKIVSSSETIISGRNIGSGMNLIINSMTQKVTALGDYEDAYYYDYFDSTYNIFQKIEPFTDDDIQVLDANRNPAANPILTVFYERSEPIWI